MLTSRLGRVLVRGAGSALSTASGRSRVAAPSHLRCLSGLPPGPGHPGQPPRQPQPQQQRQPMPGGPGPTGAGGPPGGPGGEAAPKLPLFIEANEANLMSIIQASQNEPIILYATAEWCKPCKVLGPKLAAATKKLGVTLARMNIDECKSVAEQLQIKVVPTLFVLHQGRVQKGMEGGDDKQVQALLDRVAKLGGKQTPDDVLAEGAKFLEAGNLPAAAQLYSSLLAQQENLEIFAKAGAGLIQCALKENNIEAAQSLADAVKDKCPKHLDIPAVAAAMAKVEFAGKRVADLSPLQKKVEADKNDHESRHSLAEALFANGQSEEAFNHAIEIIKRDSAWNDQAGKKLAVKILDAMGQSEAAQRGRRRLSGVLF